MWTGVIARANFCYLPRWRLKTTISQVLTTSQGQLTRLFRVTYNFKRVILVSVLNGELANSNVLQVESVASHVNQAHKDIHYLHHQCVFAYNLV